MINFYQTVDLKCTDRCESGYFGNRVDSTCQKCHPSCKECINGSKNGCTQCFISTYLLDNQLACLTVCPDGFFANLSTLHCDTVI